MPRPLLILLALALAGCPTPRSGGDDDDSASDEHDAADDDDSAETTTLRFENAGDPSLEGHTPIGFQGMGTGVFAGDNINGGFPQGDGVQIWMTIDLSEALAGTPLAGSDLSVHSATLSSTSFETRGTPFVDLGDLVATRAEFEAFGAPLWNLPLQDESCVLATSADGPVECDITTAVQAALDAGRNSLQLNIRFETAGDSDGAQDMIMFADGDTNATAPGLFQLEVEVN